MCHAACCFINALQAPPECKSIIWLFLDSSTCGKGLFLHFRDQSDTLGLLLGVYPA